MSTLKQIVPGFVLFCAVLTNASAQESSNAPAQSPSLTVTAAADGERVRITAPSSVVQMHVEVYAASGEKLFDQEIRGGNVFDWHLQNGQGKRVAPGAYVCVVTAKSVSGKLTQKIGSVNIEEKSANVQPATSPQLSALQAQAIGPVEENSSWKISGDDEPQTPTVIAHDGTDGQMIRGRGALSFRIGNFFTGNDTEQMRLTEDGRLGIGTNDPRATLDVAGTIRAQRFLVVRPKPVGPGVSAQDSLTSNATDPVDSLVTGTGTTNSIAKWLDGSGTLGDSVITETGGFVGIGTTAPGSKLVVSGNSATLPPASGIARFADADGIQTAVFADAFGTNPIFNVRRANGTAAAPSAVQANQLLGVIGASGYGASAYMGTRARVGFFASENWTNTANGTYLSFNTTANGTFTAGGTERLRIDNAGNVGIGTAIPTAKLTVLGAGAFNVTGAPRFDLFNTTAGTGFLQHVTDNGRWQIATTGGATRMVIDSNGNVGVGTDSPAARLVVSGAGDFNVPGAARFDLSNTTAGTGFLQHVNNSGLLQIATTGGASRMVIDPNGNVGVGTVAPQSKLQIAGTGTNGYTLGVEGNVTQNLSNFGFAKAMIVVNEVGTIARCFNSTISGIGATAAPCGFIVASGASAYQVNFGFQVNDRFLAITPGIAASSRNVAANYGFINATTVEVFIVLTDQQFSTTTAPFTIIVY